MSQQTSTSVHREVSLGLRPPRVAVLVDRAASWASCRQLLAALTHTWGGTTFTLLPTDGTEIPPSFLKLMTVHDPDWFTYAAFIVHIDDEGVLKHRLVNSHSVASSQGRLLWPIQPEHVYYPHTHVADVLSRGFEANITSLTVHGSEIDQVAVYACTGLLTPTSTAKLTNAGVSVTEVSVDPGAPEGAHALRDGLWRFDAAPGARYPFELAQLHLGLYLPELFTYETHPPVIVFGDTFEDFCLYWNLRTLRGAPEAPGVYWWPSQDPEVFHIRLQQQIKWEVQAYLSRMHARRGKVPVATSHSLSRDQVEAIAALPGITLGFAPPDDIKHLLPFVATVWERDNTPDQNRSVVHFVDGLGMTVLSTPTPSSVAYGPDTDVRWMVDVRVEGIQLPTRPAMTSLLAVTREALDVRASRSGLSYLAISHFIARGETARQTLVRPTLRLPSDWQVVRALCEGESLIATPSDKGQYEAGMAASLNGMPGLSAVLQDERTARVLMWFASPPANVRGQLDRGVRLADGTGYLNLAAIRTLAPTDEAGAAAIADAFLQSRWFRRGFLIKCPHCRNAGWYSVDELSDSVTCHRCTRQHVYPASSDVYFRLDELVRLALQQNSHIPLLALEHIRKASKRCFLYANGTELRRIGQEEPTSRPWHEVDFIAVSDGRALIGECKRGNGLSAREKRQFEAYADVCAQLRPDEFLACTDANEWTPSDLVFFAGLRADLSKMGTELRLLTKADLGWPL